MRVPRLQRTLIIVTLCAAGTAGCAAAAATARPSPFPRVGPPVTFRPTLGTPPAPFGANALVTTALGFQGVPYRLGGDTPESGFDCSGFVWYVYGANRVEVPRTVAELFTVGEKVRSSEIRAGDLVFFSTIAPGATHVGIALGDGRFVHAPGANGAVRLDSLGSSYWQERLLGARRLLRP